LPQPSAIQLPDVPFIELQSVDSTNNYARQQIHVGLAQHGMAIFAHEQTAGKGQRGKVWTSEKGANIALSIIINPQSLRLTQQFQLSACAAVAVHEFFNKYAGDGATIKWPNDLYWQDRKAGGILIESGVGSRESGVNTWQWAIVGIGINVNQTSFPADLHNPVSLKQITGKDFNPLLLAKEITGCLKKYFQQLLTVGFDGIYNAYISNLYKRNEKVKLRKNNRVFEAIVKTVLPTGRLVVNHAIEEEFDFGEVEWII
jgi:BirA family transcriptional regulator, biotin operon repressor / biotin---[acetyl-CoA-carboxylase] ligase